MQLPPKNGILRYRLLVGPEPRIRAYRGQGCLDGWLRRVAHTVALDSIRVRVGRERLLQRLRYDSTCGAQLQASVRPRAGSCAVCS